MREYRDEKKERVLSERRNTFLRWGVMESVKEGKKEDGHKGWNVEEEDETGGLPKSEERRQEIVVPEKRCRGMPLIQSWTVFVEALL